MDEPLLDLRPAMSRFLGYSRVRAVPAKTVVIREGQRQNTLFYVINGSVEVFIEDKEGNEFTLAYLDKGEFFGEMGLLRGQARSAQVRTRTACELAEMSYTRFREIETEAPGLVFELARQLATRIGRTSRKIRDLAFMDSAGRIARALLELRKRPEAMTLPEGMQIKITRVELARLAGCSREMAGRALADLEAQGLVKTAGRTLVLFEARPPAMKRPPGVSVQASRARGGHRGVRTGYSH